MRQPIPPCLNLSSASVPRRQKTTTSCSPWNFPQPATTQLLPSLRLTRTMQTRFAHSIFGSRYVGIMSTRVKKGTHMHKSSPPIIMDPSLLNVSPHHDETHSP